MAIISTDKGDYFGGQEFSLNALTYFDPTKEDQYRYIHSNFNNLAIAAYKLGDYQNALKFYDSAIEFARDSLDVRLYLTNKAKAYQEIHAYERALEIYTLALKVGTKNQKEYAKALTNVALTKWLQNPNYPAAPEFLKALQIRKKENDLWGLNSSFAHLSDYYAFKRSDSALIYARQMYKVAKEIKSPDDQLEALTKLVKLSPLKEIQQYFLTYEKLNDSLQTARTAAKNQFVLIRYETEKHKSENLKLQKNNIESKYQLVKQKGMLIGTVGIAILVVIFGIIWYGRRKKNMEYEAENSIRENQLKTSKKVHDVVANGLYRMMSEIENIDVIDKNALLDKVESLYERSRDISYDPPKSWDKSFPSIISSLLTSFAAEGIKILIVGNSRELWEQTDLNARYEIQFILQELMVNMRKHSKATNVVIKFELTVKHIKIHYSDDGIGISREILHKNGLKNMGNRIYGINGRINFEPTFDKGLRIQISFPTITT